MYFWKLFLFFVLCSFATGCQLVTSAVEGYYWRDYRGKIPNDAVLAGINADGKRIYIGQGLHVEPVNGKLMPGKIVEGENRMSYVWASNKDEYVLSKNIKILCTQHPENIKWTEVDAAKLKAMSHSDFIVGGFDSSYDLYIGRIRKDGNVGVGKITIRATDTFGYSDQNGKRIWVTAGFEVLSYTVENESKLNSLQCGNKTININIC